MELQRHVSIALRHTQALMKLAGQYDTGEITIGLLCAIDRCIGEIKWQVELIETRRILDDQALDKTCDGCGKKVTLLGLYPQFYRTTDGSIDRVGLCENCCDLWDTFFIDALLPLAEYVTAWKRTIPG